MILTDYQEGDLNSIVNPLEEAVKSYPKMEPQPPAFTGRIDGVVVGVGGIQILWEGVGEAWVILSQAALDHKIETYRGIFKKLKELIEECDLRRVQSVIRVDFPQAIRMIEHLGFQLEGYMKGYCPDGCDVFMYGRVK
jgi:hypothetical protein